MMPVRVAVIGAGTAGLSALYHLSRDPEHFTCVAFERSNDVGGLWVYSDQTGLDDKGHPTSFSVYNGLRTNLSKELMSFVEYPMPENYPTFPHHHQVKDYLQDYAKHFDLYKYVQFQTMVTGVKPIKKAGKVTWVVNTRNLVTNEITTDEYDAIMVCNGWTNPGFADIPGRETFHGDVIHSKDYRNAERFKDKVVTIIGMSFSGMELMFKISATAKQVYGIHNDYPNLFCAASQIPANAAQKCGIREMTTEGLILEDGEFLRCDAVVFATGYHYAYPFLQEGCNINTKGDRVTPLYKHLYHIEHPSLTFHALTRRCVHARNASAQAAHVCKVLKGEVTLPPEAVMRKDEEEYYQKRIVAAGQHSKMTHDLFGDPQWDYFRFLEGENNNDGGKFVENYFNFHIPLWTKRFHDFQTLKINVNGDETFTVE